MKGITRGGKKSALKVGNYIRKDLYIGMNNSTMKKILCEADLKCKVKQKKPKVILCEVKIRFEFAKLYCH